MEIGLNFAILIIFRIATNDNEAIISLFTSFFNIFSYEIRTGQKSIENMKLLHKQNVPPY